MMETIVHKSFEELNKKELYDLMQLRQEVFVVEQDCPYLDADGLDFKAIHVFQYNSDKMIAYSRILPPGLVYKEACAIGRVVTSKISRNAGIGRQLMVESISLCKHFYPGTLIKISAQQHLKSFYNSLGFKQTGESYLEDGIPHIAMYYNR